MGKYNTQLVFSAIIIIGLLIIRFIVKYSINKTLKKFNFSLQRRRMTIKILHFFLGTSAVFAFVAIWGIEKEKLVIFISSVLTIIGIAFFAQWSILANITAGFILFFNHPLKIGSRIKVLEKDFIIEGMVDDITFFFVHIKTKKGERITIPNSIVLQKNILVESEHPKKQSSKSVSEKTT